VSAGPAVAGSVATPARQRAITFGWSRPRLRLVASPGRHAPRVPFVLLVIALLGGGLLGPLLLNTQRAQGAFTLSDLQRHNTTLQDQVQALRLQVQQDRTPAALASRAAALGMVPGTAPLFLDASGKVLGTVPDGTPVPDAHSPHVGNIVVAGTAQRAATKPASHPATSTAAAGTPATASPSSGTTTAATGTSASGTDAPATSTGTSGHPVPPPVAATTPAPNGATP
jgi:hypothetical protein